MLEIGAQRQTCSVLLERHEKLLHVLLNLANKEFMKKAFTCARLGVIVSIYVLKTLVNTVTCFNQLACVSIRRSGCVLDMTIEQKFYIVTGKRKFHDVEISSF